jgi:hypothetical protein
MGLDMYLSGRKTPLGFKGNKQEQDGFVVSEIIVDVGYWRKHPNLHGYIVETFADGVDECQRIVLSKEDMQKIILVVVDKQLPVTEGFFFGTSDDSNDQRASDISIFSAAIDWLDAQPEDEWRDVYYQASW